MSLTRQLSMIRFIHRNNTKGVTLAEVQFQMTVTHGMSDAWVVKHLNKWRKFGVVILSGRRYKVDEDKMKNVWKAREQEELLFE